MFKDFGLRVRNLSRQARWLISVGLLFFLLMVTALCSLLWLVMMGFSLEGCGGLPSWMDAYPLLPPTLMALGAILAPLLFGLRVRWTWALGVLLFSGFGSIALYLAWIPLISLQC